jgi:hypothetical protein
MSDTPEQLSGSSVDSLKQLADELERDERELQSALGPDATAAATNTSGAASQG